MLCSVSIQEWRIEIIYLQTGVSDLFCTLFATQFVNANTPSLGCLNSKHIPSLIPHVYFPFYLVDIPPNLEGSVSCIFFSVLQCCFLLGCSGL
jgi:hypothetical protein